jgi:hypothetical protein
LPPPGPYLAGKDAHAALKTLESVGQTTHTTLELVRELKDGEAAIYALEETEKAINDALDAIRQRMKVLTEAGT